MYVKAREGYVGSSNIQWALSRVKYVSAMQCHTQ